MHCRWNRQRHSSLAMGTPTSNSSRQIVHSAESTQSFSVATYGNIPVLLGAAGGDPSSPAPADPDPVGVPLYLLCAVMQMVMCASRRASELGRVRSGSSRWQTGHSSSSAIWCRGWGIGGRLRSTCGAEDEDDAAAAAAAVDGPGPPRSSKG